jgi:hypothetical protein
VACRDATRQAASAAPGQRPVRGAGLTASEYTTIMHLSETPNRELRMAYLAKATDLSASRITRLVDDLASQGLVTKTVSAADTRGNVPRLPRRAWPSSGLRGMALAQHHQKTGGVCPRGRCDVGIRRSPLPWGLMDGSPSCGPQQQDQRRHQDRRGDHGRLRRDQRALPCRCGNRRCGRSARGRRRADWGRGGWDRAGTDAGLAGWFPRAQVR